jgi:hypothetical protein
MQQGAGDYSTWRVTVVQQSLGHGQVLDQHQAHPLMPSIRCNGQPRLCRQVASSVAVLVH